jgi:diketogulonate reductase-like aldo/keto reductase
MFVQILILKGKDHGKAKESTNHLGNRLCLDHGADLPAKPMVGWSADLSQNLCAIGADGLRLTVSDFSFYQQTTNHKTKEIMNQVQTVQAPHLQLNNGLAMPQIGLGVLKAQENGEVERAILSALETGYRKIDTAAAYRNESGVGRAIRQSAIPREEIFLTTKVWNSDQGYDRTLEAFEQSLNRLQTDYVDLYLVHWPVRGKYKETYQALEKIYAEGRAKAIGVSNFQAHHLDVLEENTGIVPAVNQVEMHPHLQQRELLNYTQQRGILLEAWRPIMMGAVMDIPELVLLGKKYGKTPVQITLRWLVQQGVSVIPKSVNPQRIAANFDVFNFDLTVEDMAMIESLNQDRRLGPDPDTFNF